MESVDLQKLKESGFEGFRSVKELKSKQISSIVPDAGGVYVIFRLNGAKPKFLEKGTGGYYQGKEPNVSVAELERNWIDGASVMYIGCTNNLSERITLLIQFGEGKAVGHYGGRLLWQLEDSDGLIVCWRATKQKPGEVKKKMIQHFKEIHNGQMPFANLK